MKRRARDPVTGKTIEVPSDMNYNEWRKSIDEKYGEGIFSRYQKMIKNEKYDKEQYLKYKSIIGKKNLPSTFEKYQEMKYNNSNEYELLKNYYSSASKNQFPNDMTYGIYKSNLTTEKWKAVGFNPQKLNIHFEKHADDFKVKTEKEYEQFAKDFMNKELSNNIVSFKSKDGYIFKYDIENNIFGDAKPNGVTETCYKPTRGIEYWKEQVKKYGN